MNAFSMGLAGADEVELHAATIRPVFKRPRLELGAVIHRDGTRPGRILEDPIQRLAHRGSGHSRRHLQYRAGATPLIDHGQNPKRATVGQGIMHEIHTPPLRGARGHRGGASVQRHVLAPPDAHAELQPVEPIQSPHPLAVDHPAFAAQQHPDPQMSKPRPRVGELPDPQPQRGLIPRPTAAIPGRSTELRQPTGPRTADLERPLKPSSQLPTARGPQAFFRSASASMCL